MKIRGMLDRKEPAMSRKIHFACLFLLLGLLLTATQSGFASDGPLNFGNNFFVTGDYVVAGAYNLNVNVANGFATGTITIPDGNPGITGIKSVPKGAQIVAALLYWQTVEKSSVMPGQAGSGENGFFRPVFRGGPQTGYPITGVNVGSHNTVSWSQGGCTGTSTEKITRTYRADVRGFLPLDANGNALVDSTDGVTFEVRLPSVGPQTPLTLGATLVLIWRVISPNFPLISTVIYDGAYMPTDVSLTMTQTVWGFYQAAQGPVSRLTYIVGSGHSNKFQTVYLEGIQNGIQRVPVQLPSPYGSGPPFPGWYGSWDNTTWTFPDPNFPHLANPLQEDDDSATTSVVPTTSQQGCVSAAAVIVSTTVHDDDKDGILPVWKNANPQGYTDVATGQFVSLADANDPPKTGQQDIFIQMDHVVDANGDFSIPVQPAIPLVESAFKAHNIHLHITHGNPSVPGSDVIQEPACTDQPANSPPYYCPYLNQVGVTAWRYGFEFVKNQGFVNNQPVNEQTCENAGNSCLRRFPIAQRNSHHYVVIGDTLGAANWTFLGGILTDHTGTTVPGAGIVSQVHNTVTFQTAKGHGLTVDDVHHTTPNGRVTVSNAITNPNLNGTFFVTSVTCPTNPDTSVLNDCSVTNKALGPYTFTINIGGNPVTANYTLKTDPYLAVFSGQATSGSGLSDVGGMGTLETLGKWGANATLSAYAGTLMHEWGHTLGLALHGGSYYDHLAQGQPIPDYRPTIEPNCKPNYQSVMNYMFQSRLLGPNGVLDFSSQQLSPLDETSLGPITTMDNSAIAFPTTDWYDTKQTFVLQVALGQTATHHCDGTPLNINDPPTYFYQGGTWTQNHPNEITIPWSSTELDANFDGTLPGTPGSEPPVFRGYNDWANVDLRQVGATGNSLLGPGGLFSGPGGLFGGPGGLFGGPGGLFGGPGGLFGGPGGLFGGPGGLFGGPGEIDFATAISVTPAPTNLSASEAVSRRTITLTWTEPNFPVTEKNNIYRSSDGVNFSFLASVSGTAPRTQNTYQDNVTCNPSGYSYFVTTVVLNTSLNPPQEQESTQSNIVSTGSDGLLTGCYTGATSATPLAVTASLGVSPSTVTVGTGVSITWSLTDDYNSTGGIVSNTGAATLLAIGPIPADPTCSTAAQPPVYLNYAQNHGGSPYPTNTYPVTPLTSGAGVAFASPKFTYSWNTSNFGAGCYFFELDTDSGQYQQTTSALTLLIYLSDSTPFITTTSLPNATVGVAYSNTLYEAGGVGPFKWTIDSGSLPPGLRLDPNTGVISGTPSATNAAGLFNFTVRVTDSNLNYGTQALTLRAVTDLNGTYAFLLRGFDPGGNAVVMAGSFTSSGGGTITSGVMDINDLSTGVSTGLTINPSTAIPPSSYTMGGARGQLTLNTSAGTQTFDFTVGSISAGIASLGHIISRQTPSAISGVFKMQDTTAFNLASIVGDFAFGFEGADSANNRTAGAGRLTINSDGSLANLAMDINDNGTVTSGLALTTGSSVDNSAIDGTTGRGTMTLSLSSGSSLHQAFYVVSANELFTVSTDMATTGTPWLYASSALRQPIAFCATTGSCNFTNNALNGNSVVYVQSNSGAGSRVQVGALTFTPANTSISGGFDQNDGGVITANTTNTVSGSYSVASNGQVTISNMTIAGGAALAPVLYLVNTNQAFLVGTNTVVDFGLAEPQVGPIAFTSGGRSIGTQAPAVSGTQVFDEVQILTATSDTTANATDTVDVNSVVGGLLESLPLPGWTLTNLDQTTGRFTFSDSISGTSPRVGYFVNANRRIVINADPTVTAPFMILSDNQYNLSSWIDSVSLNSATLTIGGATVPYTATLFNGTGSTVSSVAVQAYIDQGTASRSAGGALVACGQGDGNLPAGTCAFNFNRVVASNSNQGTGTLVAGNATARFELLVNGTSVSEFTVQVTLQ